MEIEAKYRIPDEPTCQRLLETTTLAGFGLGPWSVAVLHDSYLDTAAGSLRVGGYACRLRCWESRYRLTIKGLGNVAGAIHRRIEHEADLPGLLPPQEWPPGPARDLALDLCGDRPLLPLFQVEQTRHACLLSHDRRPVVQLSLDRGRLIHEGASLTAFLEVEAELLPEGSEADLATLCRVLEDDWGLQPQRLSKFERGLRALLNAKAGVTPDDPMSEAGRKVLRLHYRWMLYHEPGTRQGEDIEALHDMRVATRRMRAAFRVFGGYYRPRAIRPLLKGLKRTGRALGAVRDLDVFREKIQVYVAALPASQQHSLDNLLAELTARREAARQQMIAHLDGKKYARFKDRCGEFVETEGLGSRAVNLDGGIPRPHRVRHVAPLVIYERLAAVRAYDEWVSIPDPPLERLHALRIACKMLRYTLEFFREVLDPQAKAAIEQVVAVQDHLGELQDAVVARAILGDLQRWGTWGADVARSAPDRIRTAADPGVEAYLSAKEAELQHLLDTFPEVWDQIASTDFSRQVAEAVMVL